MRVTAKPSRSTSEIKIDIGSISPAPEARVAAEPVLPRTARRAMMRVALALLAVMTIAGLFTVWLVLDDSPDPAPNPPPTTAQPTATTTPTATATPTLPPDGPTGGSGEGNGLGGWTAAIVGIAVGVSVLAVVMALSLWALRRRVSGRGILRVPGGGETDTEAAAVDQPRASLGTPDVLILTESATDDDARLRERVRNHEQAIFANVQLACNFYPTEDWIFSGARLTVVLAREDGRLAPAPIAYSLRPLSDRDGSAREQSVEIGADMKFVSVKGGEKSAGPGEEFVRGYGLQESVSYWEFTATQHQPLQGSFVLWLIARAPRDSDLTVTSTLQVRVAPRSVWSRADAPAVAGTGGVSLVLGLKNGPPFQARLQGAARGGDPDPWLVDAL